MPHIFIFRHHNCPQIQPCFPFFAHVPNSNLEKIVRERFGKAVARGVGELRIKRATHSPISGLIDNTVIEVSTKQLGVCPFVE